MFNQRAICAGLDALEKRARRQFHLRFGLHVGCDLRLAKKVKQLDSGRSMLLTLRPDGKPMLLVVGRGLIRSMFINVTSPKITEADREQRLRTKTTVANSYDLHLSYVQGVQKLLACLRQVIVDLRLNGHDVAEFVNRIVDQIDGRSLDGEPGEAPKGGTVSDDEDDVDLRLGPCPEGVDEDAWAVVRKDLEAGSFAKFARMNDFAARVRSMVGKFRAGAGEEKCSNNAPAPAPAVEVAGGAPPPQQDDVPRGGTRPRGRGSSKFAHGREASSDKLIRWKFAPLEPDWASKVELGADAVETIRPTERLVDFWLRVSRPMAKALHQEFEVLNERDAPADISPLLDAVAGVVGKRKAPGAVAAAPGAKRSRGVDVTA